MALLDHLEKLKYFSSVASFGSFSQASKQLRISQPSLTHAVKILERDLDCSLFVRTNNGVILTEHGQTLLEFANRISEQGHFTEAKIRSNNNDLDFHLRIGTHESISIYFFPYFLRYLDSAHPNLNISLRTGRSRAVIELLKDGNIDLSMSISPPKTREFASQTLYIDSFNFFVLPSLARSYKKLPIILMSEAMATSDKVLEEVVRSKIKSKPKIIKCENHETAKAFAEQGIGIAVIPDLVARPSILKGLLMKLPSSHYPTNLAPHEISLCWLAKRSEEKNLQNIRNEIIRYVDVWLSR